MKQVSLDERRTHVDAPVAAVDSGQAITLTRFGQPIVPLTGAIRLLPAQAHAPPALEHARRFVRAEQPRVGPEPPLQPR